MDSSTWDNIFLGFSRVSGHLYNPYSPDNEPICRPNEEQLSQVMERAVVHHSSRPLEQVFKDAQEIFSYGFRVGHPRFFSVIPSPSSPESWLGETITAAFNPFGGSWEAGTGVCAVEKSLIRWISKQFGLPSSAGGQFVSGASMANLTALTIARDQILGDSIARRCKGVAYISDQTHFCVAKALRIIGFSTDNIRIIPSNAQFQMDITELKTAIIRDLLSDQAPFVIVATCGTTSTGSIDRLEEIADIANKHNIWFHVDAAYGGSVAFSKCYREMVSGLQHADSIAWDAHKWLFQTHGCGAVFFRNKAHPLKSFAASGYIVADLEDTEDNQDPQDPWNYGIELTRPARHMRLWFSLQLLGLDKIDSMISRGIHLAKLAEKELRCLPHWEIISSGTMAILNFRFAPKGCDTAELDRLNTLVSKELAATDVAAIFTIRLHGAIGLRLCTINPRTTDDEIRYVVAALNQKAKEIYGAKHYCKEASQHGG